MATNDAPLNVAASRGLSLALSQAPQAQGVIFEESFDAQPDWHSGLPENDQGGLKLADNGLPGGWPVDISQSVGTHTVPVGWNHVRQTPEFAPSRGYPTKHEPIEILAASTSENPNRARGGTGKSMVLWRESTDGAWHNDKMLMKILDQAYEQMYVEFYINLSNELIANYYDQTVREDQNMSKFFRAFNWNGVGDIFQFTGDEYYDNKTPYMTWGMEGRPLSKSGFGFRNGLSFTTKRTVPKIAGEDRFIDWDGNPADTIGTSYHPITTTKQGTDILTNQLTGQPMAADLETLPAVDVDMIFGDETHWTKVAFFMSLNSAPGVNDGVLKQWIDGKLIVDITTMQWVSATKTMPAGWNVVALGGNDYFRSYLETEAYEHWFAFDDLIVRDSIPEELV